MKTESIGQRVRRLRLERGMRIIDLADRTRSNKGTIGQFERGEYSTNMFTFIEVAKVLDVSLDYLAYGDVVRSE